MKILQKDLLTLHCIINTKTAKMRFSYLNTTFLRIYFWMFKKFIFREDLILQILAKFTKTFPRESLYTSTWTLLSLLDYMMITRNITVLISTKKIYFHFPGIWWYQFIQRKSSYTHTGIRRWNHSHGQWLHLHKI